MRWRERGVFRPGIGLAAALGFALVAHNAQAVTPPAIGTADAQLQIPALFETVTINLRDIGAVTGSPALIVDARQIQLFLNERPISGLVIRPVQSGGPGDVCISIENGNFNPPVEGEIDYTMQLAVSSSSIPTPVFGTIGIANVGGPVVDTEEEIDACGDPNTAPIANTSNTVTTVRDDEVIVLDGNGSSDIDAGTVLSYEWSGPNLELPPSQQPTAEVGPLPPGTYTFALVVRDDSQTQNNVSEPSTVTVTVVPATFPTANAGADQAVDDRDADGVETVTLAAIDPDNTVARFVWSLGEDVIGEGQSLPYEFEVGTYEVTLQVFDEAGRSASDEVSVAVRAARPPTAEAGEPQSVQDSDGVPGEDVVLSGSGADPDGNTVNLQWFANDSLLGSGSRLETRLPDGVNEVELVVTDSTGQTGSDTVVITIANAIAPTANAGDDRRVVDSDGQVGESVTLNGSASVANGGIASYEWRSAQGEVLASGVTPTVRLPDGANVITLLVTNNAGATASDTTTITVDVAAQAPVANAGADQTIADGDREPGELVTLSGAGTDPNGQTLNYQWSLQSDPVVVLGSQQTLAVRLPDGENMVTLRVEDPDGNFATDTAAVRVAAPAARVALAELPNLSANKRSIALALDRACLDLDQQSRTEAQLTEDQQAMLTRCNGLYFDNTQENQTQALDALSAEDFAAARTQTLLFSNTLYASVMDRLVALRGGARGLSLAGLNIVVDGQFVPLAQLQEMAKGLLGGGASSDADQAGGLFGDKLGVWARGNFSFGEKDQSAASPRFEADQWALIGGLDYRLTERSVIGASFAYGESGIEFDPAGEGALDTTSWAASTYGSLYAAKNFYFDGILNVAKSDYSAERNITYVDGTGLIDTDAQGTTDGMTLSGGVSAGYDFLWGRFTFSPTLGAFYIDATIDGFTESGAAGLNLIYDEQNFSSLTGNLGLRMTYAVNTGWGVLLPHVRIDYVREFEDDVDVFGVRFAGDPNANSAPPILVETDNPDRSYWRLATGFSAQFAHGFSGYVEYQRLESFEFISFEDLSVGLRMQKSF
jgi:uncharacterized protein YhjY with autotransporter beta-barrel domain